MPTYDFACQDCGQRFSRFTSIKEKDNTTCPECGSGNVRQRFTGFMFFKSSGGGKPAGSVTGSSGGCSSGGCGGCTGCA